MFLPAIVFVGGVYYAHRVVGTLANVLFGSIIFEQRLDLHNARFENEQHAKNYYLDLNPLKLENQEKVDAFRQTLGMPTLGSFSHFWIKKEEIAPEQEYIIGEYWLTPSEAAQFRDVIKYDALTRKVGIGKLFAEACERSKLNPDEIAKLCWPESNAFNTDLTWFKTVSQRRAKDLEFLADLEFTGEKQET